MFYKKLPNNISFLIHSRELQKFLGFVFFIHFNWGALGVIVPLWFDQEKSLQNFTYYYSSLTFVAGTSFLWTNIIYKLDIGKLSFLLSFLYLIRGILLLFPTYIFLSILSGLCGGIAIILYILISITWTNSWDDDLEKSYVIGWSSSEFRIATALSVALASLGVSILGTKLFGFFIMILSFSIMPFMSHFFLKRSNLKIIKKPVGSVVSKIYECFHSHKHLMKWTLICSIFFGFQIGLTTPYFPLLLKKIGFNSSMSLSLISIGNFLKIFCPLLLNSIYRPSKKGIQICMIGFINMLALGMWSTNLSLSYLIPFVLITFVMQAAFTFFETNIYYAIFPKDWSLQLFTLSSFVFHLSNIAGNFLGNIMISQENIQGLICLGAFIIGLTGLLYHLFINSVKLNSSMMLLILAFLNY